VTIRNFVTPKVRAKHELFFNKPASAYFTRVVKKEKKCILTLIPASPPEVKESRVSGVRFATKRF
jgi:hypothetical protein